jgi:hypothetical protein
MIVAQLTSGYDASKINFTIIENRCLVMCKMCSFCLTRGPETGLTGITVGLTGLFGNQIGQTNVQTSLTSSCAFDSTCLGPRVGDSATVPLEEDKAKLQVLRGYDFDYLHDFSERVDIKVWKLLIIFS